MARSGDRWRGAGHRRRPHENRTTVPGLPATATARRRCRCRRCAHSFRGPVSAIQHHGARRWTQFGRRLAGDQATRTIQHHPPRRFMYLSCPALVQHSHHVCISTLLLPRGVTIALLLPTRTLLRLRVHTNIDGLSRPPPPPPPPALASSRPHQHPHLIQRHLNISLKGRNAIPASGTPLSAARVRPLSF